MAGTSAPHARGVVLAFNAGSSSLKFEAFGLRPAWRSLLRARIVDIGGARPALEWDDAEAEPITDVDSPAAAADVVLERLEAEAGSLTAAGPIAVTAHRVVHGGADYSAPQIVTAQVRERLERLGTLAPLHNPHATAVMDRVGARYPAVPAVAVFDTAFFRDLPAHVRRYAVPAAWHERGVERYGFHGIAHRCLRDRLAELTETAVLPARVLTLHLGHGCSMTALRDGTPVETSMGFTPVEGLVMGTRSGDLDVGAVTHMGRSGRSWEALDAELNRESGLLGLSGASADMRELVELERAGHAGARLAIAAFCHRIHKYLGAYAAVLGGVDTIVFGGGIGEHAPSIRERVCEGLAWLGLELDAERNRTALGTEARISTPDSPIDVYVISVHEEDAIARAALACLDAESGGASDASFHHS